MKIVVSPKFLKEYEDIVNNYPFIARKVISFKNDCRVFWFSHALFTKYDIKWLWEGFFRIKFPPLRIIVFVNDTVIAFEKIFKRKWHSDYDFLK